MLAANPLIGAADQHGNAVDQMELMAVQAMEGEAGEAQQGHKGRSRETNPAKTRAAGSSRRGVW